LEKKLTTDEEDSSTSDDDGNIDYDIDPETGEKIFREAAFASNTSLSSPNDKWIEEYLSNIESSSNQILPTTTNNSELLLDNIPFSFGEQTDSDWFSNIINLDENSDSIMFTDPIIPDQITTTSSSPIYIPLSNENPHNQLSASVDDEYSTSSSSNGTHQHQLYSSLENDNDMVFVDAKLEKNRTR